MTRKAIFLDRDGVIISNRDHYYIWKPEQIELVEGIEKNLKRIIDHGFLLFVVSNQGGIAKGLYTKTDTDRVHAELMKRLAENGITIQEIVYCPHHPEKETCICRKPGSLLIDKLIDKYKVDKTQSFMIGDSPTDMEAAENAGIKGILIDPNSDMLSHISFLIS